jgi:hypothetical protein
MDWNLFVITTIILLIVTGIVCISAHETIHQQIFARYGVTSHVVWFADNNSPASLFGKTLAVTVPENKCNLNIDNCNRMWEEQQINETIGYQIQAIMFGIMGAIIIGFICIGVRYP